MPSNSIFSFQVHKSQMPPWPTRNIRKPIRLSGYLGFSWPLGNHTQDLQNAKIRLTIMMPPSKPNTSKRKPSALLTAWPAVRRDELCAARWLSSLKKVTGSRNNENTAGVTGNSDISPLPGPF